MESCNESNKTDGINEVIKITQVLLNDQEAKDYHKFKDNLDKAREEVADENKITTIMLCLVCVFLFCLALYFGVR